MTPGDAVTETRLDLPLYSRGKVRDTYRVDDDRLLMVTTDRISAFDWVLPTAIPDRGRVLAQLSAFWFQRTDDTIENHLLAVGDEGLAPGLEGRCLIVRRAERIDFECVVRGYLAGSAWTDYRRTGTISGERLPGGMRMSERLPEPMFTPATKAESGHDENVSVHRFRADLGVELADRLRDVSLRLYHEAARHAERQGLILADTKFEFGLIDGRLALIDEALTPDSSRYWDAATYAVGSTPHAFDKQFVRDWLLNESGWDRESLPPALPPAIVRQTRERYLAAYELLTGRPLFQTAR